MSPIFPVVGDGVSSVVPGAVTSKLTAKSAEAVTFTRLDIAEIKYDWRVELSK